MDAGSKPLFSPLSALLAWKLSMEAALRRRKEVAHDSVETCLRTAGAARWRPVSSRTTLAAGRSQNRTSYGWLAEGRQSQRPVAEVVFSRSGEMGGVSAEVFRGAQKTAAGLGADFARRRTRYGDV